MSTAQPANFLVSQFSVSVFLRQFPLLRILGRVFLPGWLALCKFPSYIRCSRARIEPLQQIIRSPQITQLQTPQYPAAVRATATKHVPNHFYLLYQTNALYKTCTNNKDVCTCTLTNIPKKKVRYMSLLYQQSTTPPLSEATWGIRTVLVLWNKAAREQLVTNNRSW